MATLGQLRGMAKMAGIPASTIRSATSADELQKLITEAMNGGSPAKPARKPAAKPGRKPVKKPVTKKVTTTTRTPRKSQPAAKSTPGKVKRTTAVNGDAGRNLLGKVNYSLTENWNPRPGSPPDLIIKALRKFKGDRTKVFEALKGDIKNFVKPKMNDGTLRSKASREEMLKYRISRTAWDFAMKTGQHEKSENRVEYGTHTPKPVRKATAPRKPVAARKPVKKVTRPAKKRTVKR